MPIGWPLLVLIGLEPEDALSQAEQVHEPVRLPGQ